MAAPIPDYHLALPGVRRVKAGMAVAGVVGTLAVFGVAWGLAGVFSRRSSMDSGGMGVPDSGS